MAFAIREKTASRRGGDRVALTTRIRIAGRDGRPLLEEAVCSNIGLGGLCVRASTVLSPGTPVSIELRLTGDRAFACKGTVCWSKTTLHPALLGTPKGIPDDACFGIRFDGASTQDLLPIARLMVAREDSRRRARRMRRLYGPAARA